MTEQELEHARDTLAKANKIMATIDLLNKFDRFGSRISVEVRSSEIWEMEMRRDVVAAGVEIWKIRQQELLAALSLTPPAAPAVPAIVPVPNSEPPAALVVGNSSPELVALQVAAHR